MRVILTLLLAFSCHFSLAQPDFQDGDWKVYKNINTSLNKRGCIAETIQQIELNGAKSQWALQVVRLESQNGDHSYPIVLSYPISHINNGYYEARGQSNKEGAPSFSMTLLQPGDGNQSIVASRKRDRLMILRHLKAGKIFNVDYLNKDGVLHTVPFSLTGSSTTIKKMTKMCP